MNVSPFLPLPGEDIALDIGGRSDETGDLFDGAIGHAPEERHRPQEIDGGHVIR